MMWQGVACPEQKEDASLQNPSPGHPWQTSHRSSSPTSTICAPPARPARRSAATGPICCSCSAGCRPRAYRWRPPTPPFCAATRPTWARSATPLPPRRASCPRCAAPTRGCSPAIWCRATRPRWCLGPSSGARFRPRSSPSELDQVLDPPVGDDPRGLRDRALLELLYGSGLRASEACTLRVRDVDRGRRQIRVTGKGDKQRMVPLGGAAEQALDRYLARGRPCARPRPGRPAVPERAGTAAAAVRRAPHAGAVAQPSRAGVALTARAAALICHSSPGGRCRSPQHPGDAWPRIRGHDPGIHPRERAAS